ncbi:MAG: DUF1697 domain-containing protein [Ignavibacteria bacterium]
MSKYAAFLRGINVGGHKPVKMDELKKALELTGFKNVKTLLASGNILFETSKMPTYKLSKKIDEALEKKFEFKIPVIVRTLEELQELSDSDPFKGIEVTPQTRLYITFLSEEVKSNLKIPYESPEKNFKIIHVTKNEICSVLTLTPESKTVELMGVLEKEFGKNVTTRNWNTIIKLLK